MSGTQQEILDVLRKAYQIEVDGYSFYTMVADRATKPAVQALFEKLAQDEMEHKAYLRDIARDYEKNGPGAFAVGRRNPDFKEVANKIFTPEFRKQAEGATFEFSALSIGMQLETNAIAHFNAAARNATEKEVKEFYLFLEDWEKQHLETLRRLHEGVRDDFWTQGGFAPF